MPQEIVDLALQDGGVVDQPFGARQRLARGVVVLARLLIQFHDIVGDKARAIYCVPGPTHFATFNAVYDRYFPKDAPSRIFMFIHSWPGPFDLEIDCMAVLPT